MKKTVLILGASSTIAKATAIEFAKEGYPLYLAGRDVDDLQRIAQNLKIRFQIDVDYGLFDALDVDQHEAFLNEVMEKTRGLSGVILAFGYLGNHLKAIKDFREEKNILEVNFFGACSILHHIANVFEEQKEGFIIGITSVSGDRGRANNYIYGSAKGALSIYLQGLRNRLFKSNVHVLTVKPGFVDSPMTYPMKNKRLVASAESIGRGVLKALKNQRNVVYLPWFWRWIMTGICAIPEWLFKKMKL